MKETKKSKTPKICKIIFILIILYSLLFILYIPLKKVKENGAEYLMYRKTVNTGLYIFSGTSKVISLFEKFDCTQTLPLGVGII